MTDGSGFFAAARRVLLVTLSVWLVACSSGIEGTYEDPTGLTRYTFQADGKVRMGMLGTEVEMTYEKEGNEIKVGTPQGRVVMTLQEDGTIQGPMGVKLTRKQP